MSEHALYCIDSPSAETLASADHMSGWLVCSKKVASIEARLADDTPCPVAYGLPRPDVAESFAPYPAAGHSGFRLDFPAGALAESSGVRLDLSLAGAFGLKRRYDLVLSPSTNGLRTVELRPAGGGPRFAAEGLEQRLEASLAERPGLTLRLDVVNKCNLRCVMCYFNDPAYFNRPMEKTTPEEFRRLFEDIAPRLRSVVLSCANEPLTSNHFPEILSYLVDTHPHVEVEFCTNAMLMNARIRRLLVEKGVSHLLLSMDGATKATLERIRVGSKYERIVGNILALADLKRRSGSEYPRLVMNFIMMEDNVHEAPVFVAIAARFGVGLIDFRHVIPGYFNQPELMLANHPAKYNHFRERILEEAKRHRIEVVLPPPFETFESFDPASCPEADLSEFEAVRPDRDDGGAVPVPRRFPRGFRPRSTRGTAAELFATTYCDRPFSEMFINDDKEVRPCSWYQGHLGRLAEDTTLSEIFFGPEARRLRQNMLRPEGDPGCRGCPRKSEYVMTQMQRSAPERLVSLVSRRARRLLDFRR